MTAVEPMDRRQPHIRLRPNIRVRRHIPVRRHIRVRPVRINGEPGRGVNEDGFGLVELIIAIVILTTVMVSGAQLVAGMAFAA
ncbi:MAG: prepilin-type N-terminal cleavage/methylation domain-containing protein, partial [Acidimicrobiales bacterium]